jgi:hypothetical protein
MPTRGAARRFPSSASPRCRFAFSAPGRGSTPWNFSSPSAWSDGSSAWATSWGWSRRRRPNSTSLHRKTGRKLAKNSFDLQDFLDQIKMVRKLGPLQNVLGMIPGMPKMPDSVDGEKSLRRVEAMIRSMTPEERSRPGSERPPAAAHRARQRRQRDGTQRTFASVRRDEKDDAAAHPRRKPGQDAAQFNGQALDNSKKTQLWQ